MKKVFGAIWIYLKDWRNLLSHALVGFAILAVGLFLPVQPVYRVVILLLIVGFNLVRMKLTEKKDEAPVLEIAND